LDPPGLHIWEDFFLTAFVLGNGQSRLAIDPQQLVGLGKIYGCNALYRSFSPDVLVATDRGMAAEIEDSGYAQHRIFYTRRPRPQTGARIIPPEYYGYSSGPVATSLAAADRWDPIYLLGFDMGPDPQGHFNNVYAGTPNYKPQGSIPTFTGNWIKQLKRIMRDHQQQQFIRVMGDTSAAISEFDDFKNLKNMAIQDFLAWINKQKDS
jgi:hypothetical protein